MNLYTAVVGGVDTFAAVGRMFHGGPLRRDKWSWWRNACCISAWFVTDANKDVTSSSVFCILRFDLNLHQACVRRVSLNLKWWCETQNTQWSRWWAYATLYCNPHGIGWSVPCRNLAQWCRVASIATPPRLLPLSSQPSQGMPCFSCFTCFSFF